MKLYKILSVLLGIACFMTAVRGHYIIAGILFVIAVLCAQQGVSSPQQSSDREQE